MTVEEFAARYRVKLEVEPITGQPPDATFDGNWYQVTVYSPRGALRENFGMGYGLSEQPTLDDVLADLASQARDQEDCPTWRDFAAEYGYGNDPESAREIFRRQRATVRRLRDLLGGKALADLRETDYT